VAPTEVTVLVVGENGTGKDAFSKIIHSLSPRKHRPFIAINCGAIPEGTIDSELFGHEKGSFTSAYDSRKGYFEETNGGMIFLDEIAEMPLPTQARLLRVLENGEYLRVGSSKVMKTDVRVVAATNRNLIDLIRTGKFREDLYFRLNTITIYVPPLRERGDDIELLFRFFAAEFAQRYGRQPVRLAPDAVPALYQYHWPGNVRELRNFVEKVTVLSKGEFISAAEMEDYLPMSSSRLPVPANPIASGTDSGYDYAHDSSRTNGRTKASGEGYGNGGMDNELLYRFFFELKSELAEIKHTLSALAQTGPHYTDAPVVHTKRTIGDVIVQQPTSINFRSAAPTVVPYVDDEPASHAQVVEETLSLEQTEMEMIAKALQKYQQNRKKAAAELGISERTLYRKIKSYGLDK
jgi:transcriptional regulator with PAS, ATPase and Fis domain